VLFAGRVMPSKGARSLIRAVASLDRATRPVVRIAGDGPDLDATVREARARDVRLETLGRLSPEAMRQAYDHATVVAVPSLWGEPFGLVGIEAFARGRPVVAYAAGAIPEWLAPSGQMAVARGDTRALAASIAALLPAQVWDAASARALDAAQTYRLSTHVDELRSIYAATR
jgi:glycosyltransferase involved in cell wall biosynthesis